MRATGKLRLIVDLRRLNASSETPKFQYESIQLSAKTKPVEAQLETDASQTGWGAVLNGKQAAGYWDAQEVRMPSNYREVLAILLV